MTRETAIKLFNERQIRTHWDVRINTFCENSNMRHTDVAETEQLFRLIQSIPSPKAEPFKIWLVRVGRERVDEIEDPDLGIDRLMETIESEKHHDRH